MGSTCSRSLNVSRHVNPYQAAGSVNQADNKQDFMNPPQVVERREKESKEVMQLDQESKKFEGSVLVSEFGKPQNGTNLDDFYDGIPRYNRTMSQKSRSRRSTHAAVAKVSEVSSRLGRAGTLSLGMAVDVLDTLGSSMTNLNPSSGFVSGVTTKGNDISILAFEVANTIVKGSSLMQSLTKRSTNFLKEVVLPTEGVQLLVSKDMDELLRIVAADKRDELSIFSGEVVRFGNRCKDPQWHNLDRYFEKISRELTPQPHLKEQAESAMLQLLTLVQHTVELYHELHSVDRFEQEYQRKRLEDAISSSTHKGDGLSMLKAELKSQQKHVKMLKKKSLWCRSLEEVMEKLVEIVHFLHLEIHCNFENSDKDKILKGSASNHKKLGPAGLDLHYANIVLQIDTLVARSSSMPLSIRDALYQSLPPTIKSSLRSKLQFFHIKEELTVTEIKAEMEKTLHWLVPLSTNTAKAHHGFGWVGEWANTGSEANKKTAVQADVILIETLHHADKEKTEAYILELVVWLHHLVRKTKTVVQGRSPMKPLKTDVKPKHELVTTPSTAKITIDQDTLQSASVTTQSRRISKSLDFDYGRRKLRKDDRLSKSTNGYSEPSKESIPTKGLSFTVPVIDFSTDKEKTLNIIDKVNAIEHR